MSGLLQTMTFMKSLLTILHEPPSFLVLSGILRASKTLSFKKIEEYTTRAIKEVGSADLEDISPEAPVAHAVEALIIATKSQDPDIIMRASYETLRLTSIP